MEVNRISVKFPVADPAAVDPDKLVPLFHRWIQERLVEDTLVDVADYSHVPDGPGVLLVGHEGDYAIDYMAGKPQMMYLRKRHMTGDVRERLRLALRMALQGAVTMSANPAPHGPIAFRTDELTIAFIDRLHLPNTDVSWAKVRGDVEAVIADVYEGSAKVERIAGDPRDNLTARVTAKVSVDPTALLERLNAAVAG